MPYRSLPDRAFWKACRLARDFDADSLYQPRFQINAQDGIATAGSCFAQNVGRFLRASTANFLDVEPAPVGLAGDAAQAQGFELYSARYGNIYTARQWAQLIEDASSLSLHEAATWQSDGRYYDGLRPNIEPEGLASALDVSTLRLSHLRSLQALFDQTDVFVFTLGLTETWADTATGLVYPTCPGVVAGEYDENLHSFSNATTSEVVADLRRAMSALRAHNPKMRFLFTVSPVPLTATMSGDHVLAATTYSKSVLRAAVGEVMAEDDAADYFPSYEIFTGTPYRAAFYRENLRNVSEDGVRFAMSLFFAAHPDISAEAPLLEAAPNTLALPMGEDEADAVICEEELLEAFICEDEGLDEARS